MAKGLKVGDTFKLEFRVTGEWGEGRVSATNPHLPAPITINEGEIPDETVTRGKGASASSAKADVTYIVYAKYDDGLWHDIMSTRDREEADEMAAKFDKARIEEVGRRKKR